MKNALLRLIVISLVAVVASSQAATLTVTNSADSGDGTLRQAILDANADASPDLVTIEFNIPAAGVQTIAPLTPLPAITRPVAIDGYTQTGASPNTLSDDDNAILLIQLTGTNASGQPGLFLQAGSDGSLVRGLVINGFTANGGIYILGSSSNVIAGNFIGTTATGQTNLENSDGVDIQTASFNLIGGTTPAARNVISGNGVFGIYFYGPCTSNLVQGNFIGTDVTGTNALGNVEGVVVRADEANVIGGTSASERNIISGNSSYAISMETLGTIVQGNFIGTDVSGGKAVPNGGGISIGGSNSLIGGAATGSGNLISGNIGAGIDISTSGNIIQGNFIGVDVTGTNALGNGGFGVVAVLSASENLIGGTAPGARNVISRNFHGIGIYSGSNNVIQGNFIGTDATGVRGLGNDEYGIYLGDSAPGTLIGGTAPGAGNLVSGNGYEGINLNSPGAIIQGNFIGTDVMGTNSVFNGAGYNGIILGVSGAFTQVGGTTAAARNVISGDGGIGIYSSTNLIQGNYLGIGVDGQTIVGDPGFGIYIDTAAEGNLLGGDVAGAGNLISGWFAAIRIAGSNNVVQGNLIGTDATGTLPRSIQNYAVTIWGQNNLIGGLTPGARNVISASVVGIGVNGNAATGNTIQGNFIGTDITGANALTNYQGISIEYAPANLIGGTTSAARNVISGSSGYAIGIGYDGASNNVVQGNYIGLAADGVTSLPNYSGVRFAPGALNNLFGGAVSGVGNWVAYNQQWGVSSVGEGVTNNAILGNNIFSNGWWGIDLGEDGVTANDLGDGDDGQNHLQNFPEITAAKLVSSDLYLTYRVDSVVENSAYPLTVEFFHADASGQGKTFLFRHTYTMPQAFTTITFTPTATVNTGDPIVATATDANGNTSEFSAEKGIVDRITVTTTEDSGPGSLRQAIADAVPGETIDFSVTGTVLLASHLEINKSLIIVGPGATNLVIRGSYGRIFNVTAGPTVISGLTLSYGWDLFDDQLGGGGILNSAHLTLKSCELTHNESIYRGGAVMNSGVSATLIAEGCTFFDNSMPGGSGDGGGAIWSDSVLRITNCTFLDNYSVLNGGAVDSSGDAVIASCTIVGNRADYGSGGGIFNDGGTLALQNTILSGNLFFYGFDHQEVGGSITSGDYNLIQYTNGLVVPGTHNVLGQDPVLSPLRNLGGPTRTCGLGSTSTALDVADGATSPPTDQRGVARPVGAGFDIGAFEGALPPNNPPVVANPIPPLFVSYGDTVQYVIPLNTFTDADAGQTLSYSMRDPSYAFTFDPNTRTVSGTAYGIGTNTVTFMATDDGAPTLSVSNEFDIVVSKRPITMRADDLQRPFGMTEQPLTLTYFNLVGPASDFDTPPVVLTTATPASVPGAYPISVSGGSDNAYEFVGWTNGTLTVLDFSVNYEVVRPFGFSNMLGTFPEAPLLQASDGKLYGTASEGVFRIGQDGAGYEVVFHFSSILNQPYRSLGALVEGADGALYGTTYDGGASNLGTVFKVGKDGSGSALLHSFTGDTDDSGQPVALVQGTNGLLYGITRGYYPTTPVLFAINTNGSGYTNLHQFIAATEGDQPATLFQGSDGKLYGTTAGSFSNPNVVFRLDTDGSNFEVIFTPDFGLGPIVTEASDGFLYGIIEYDSGIFRLNRDGTGYTNLYTMSSASDGSYPFDAVVEGPDGALYGTTYYDGPFFAGTIFKINKDGTGFSVLHACAFDDGGPRFLQKRLTAGSAGEIHGVSYYQGAFGSGCLFKMKTNGENFQVTWSFNNSGGDGYPGGAGQFKDTVIESDGGKLYGTTFNGGGGAAGTVFTMNHDGTEYTLLHEFQGSDGRNPSALLIGQDGILYGTTSSDTTNSAGNVFRVNPDGTGFSVLHTFGGYAEPDGFGPVGLVQNTNGLLRGVTYSGNVFSIDTNGDNFTILRSLTSTEGQQPDGLLRGTDGALYITASTGGGAFAGTICRLDPSDLAFAILHEFTNSDGYGPTGPLCEGSDGALYGVTSYGGAFGSGTAFRINTNGSGFAVLHDFTSGANPYGGIVEGLDGNLYGATRQGGVYSGGTLFQMARDGSEFVTIHHFKIADGYTPTSPLTLAADGSLHGLTAYGGAPGLGVLFRAAIVENHSPFVNIPIPDRTNVYGSPLNYTFAANSFEDPDPGQLLAYSATGLPTGIAFDGPTRTFSGTPTNTGTFSVTVVATDNGAPALNTNDSFNIVVDKAPLTVSASNTNRPYGEANPTFTGTLIGVTNSDDLTATFSTIATPASLPGDYPITLMVLDPDSRLGNYIVSTNLGTLTVNGVTLEFSLSGGSPNFCWPTSAADFGLEFTDELTPPIVWQPVTSGLSTNDSTICLTATPSSATPTRFYRLNLP